MGVVVKQSFISSVITYVGAVIGYFNVLWLYPKFFNNLDEIGLFRVVVDTAILLVPFAQLGLSTTLIKFFPNFKSFNKGNKTLLNTFLVISVFCFLLFFVVFYFLDPWIRGVFTQKSPQVIPYLKIVLTLIFILSVTGILEAYSRSMLKIVMPNIIKEVLIRLLSSVIVTLYFFKILDMDGLIMSLVGIYFIALLALWLYLLWLKEISLGIDFSLFNKSRIKTMANYSMFAFLNSGSNLIVMKIDSLMIAALISLNSNAIYTTAFFIATVIEMPRRSISQIMGPLVADNFKSNNFAEIKSLYQKSSLILFIISVLLFIGIIANIDSLYFLIPKWREFAPGKIVVVIIGLAKIIEMVTGINGEIIVMSKYYRFNMLAITILAVFTITTNSILIPIYGLAGAAFATLLSVTVFNAIKMIFIKVKLKMVPFTFKTFIVLLLGIGVYAISTLIPRLPNPILAIIVKSIVITIIYGFVIIRFNISPQITRLFNELKGKVFS